MKKDKQATPTEAAGRAASADQTQAVSMELGLKERRRLIRPLPVPEAIESDGDTVWGTFQELISEDPPK